MPNDPADSPLPASAADPLGGTKYRSLRRLGRGAVGEVFEAEHVALGKRVVVKLLRDEYKADPTIIDRMRVEWEALAKLDSRHLVQVTDCGATPAGRPFYVMESLQGRTLRDELKERGVLAPAEAIEVTRQLLEALRVVHAAGLVHRDVKPENVFCASIMGERVVKLLDFGIVKVISGDKRFRAPEKPTDQGVALGTPRYFAPEQAMGRPVDGRADLYAVGALLYAALAGRGPFDDVRGIANLFHAHVNEAPKAPSVLSPQSVPAALDWIVLRALEKKPEDRFADASAFLAALEAVTVVDTTPDAGGADVDGELDTTTLPTEPLAKRSPAAAPAKKWAATEPMPEPTPRPGLGKFGTVEMEKVPRAALVARRPLPAPPPPSLDESPRPPADAVAAADSGRVSSRRFAAILIVAAVVVAGLLALLFAFARGG